MNLFTTVFSAPPGKALRVPLLSEKQVFTKRHVPHRKTVSPPLHLEIKSPPAPGQLRVLYKTPEEHEEGISINASPYCWQLSRLSALTYLHK